MSKDEKPCDGNCEGCDCEFQADRNAVFLQELCDVAYAAIHSNFGPPEDLTDTDFEIVAAAILSLTKVTLENDLQVFDLKDIKSPVEKDVN